MGTTGAADISSVPTINFWTRHTSKTDSTQDHIFRMAAKGAPHGTVLVADTQTKGRGRLGRTWLSPEGGLYLSVLLETEKLPLPFPLVPLAAGLALHDLVTGLGVECFVKWPNDLIANRKKLAGILCESRDNRIAVGVGLNLVAAPLDTAASLADLLPPAAAPDKNQIITRLLEFLSDRWNREDTAAEVDARLYEKGGAAEYDGGRVTVLGVTGEGCLRILRAGKEESVSSGEILFY